MVAASIRKDSRESGRRTEQKLTFIELPILPLQGHALEWLVGLGNVVGVQRAELFRHRHARLRGPQLLLLLLGLAPGRRPAGVLVRLVEEGSVVFVGSHGGARRGGADGVWMSATGCGPGVRRGVGGAGRGEGLRRKMGGSSKSQEAGAR